MTAEIPKPAEIRKTKGYLWRRIFCKWPLLVWIGMCLLTYQLFQRGVRFERMNGVVVAEMETISALEDGIIKEISVSENGELVDAGQLIVQIDDSLASSEMKEREQELKFEKIDQGRKFGMLKSGYLTDIAKLKAERDGAKAQFEILSATLPGLKARVDARAIKGREYTDALTEAKTLETSLPYYDQTLKGLNEAVANVDELLADLKKFNDNEGADPAGLQIFKDRINRMKLTSPTGGKVANIFFRKGAVVRGGDPIVQIINIEAISARGFIQEEDADKVSVGMQIFISPTGEATDKIFPGKITYVAPQISSIPDVGSSVSGRMIKGREITCEFDDPKVALLPGQSISIHLEKPGKLNLFSFGKK